MSEYKSLPRLLINPSVIRGNILKMSKKAVRNGAELRPHFKTHQSKMIGSWFRDHDVHAITVSSVEMAEYFDDNGWDEITIAFPFMPADIERIRDLTHHQKINLLLSDESVLSRLTALSLPETGVFIDIDAGYGRSGFDVHDVKKLTRIVDQLSDMPQVTIKGFYLHAGNMYKLQNPNDIINTASELLDTVEKWLARFGLPLSYGDTPSCSLVDDLRSVSMLGPGNFVFYDLMQHYKGACAVTDIGVALECRVAAKYPDRHEMLIHGGAVHLSKESILVNDKLIYGMAIKTEDFVQNRLTTPLQPVIQLSQEHGTVRADDQFLKDISTGDSIVILPVHSCLTADCMGGYWDPESGKKVDHMREKR